MISSIAGLCSLNLVMCNSSPKRYKSHARRPKKKIYIDISTTKKQDITSNEKKWILQSTHPDVLMSSVKLAQATKSSRNPSTRDSCPLCLSKTALLMSASTGAHIKTNADKTDNKFTSDMMLLAAEVWLRSDAMFAIKSHLIARGRRLLLLLRVFSGLANHFRDATPSAKRTRGWSRRWCRGKRL